MPVDYRDDELEWLSTGIVATEREPMRRLAAEFLGTFLLVFAAVGSAVFGIDKIGAVGVALTFGLVLLALAYAIGPISGCHVNPAVTLGVLLSRRIAAREAFGYCVAQILGAIAGAALIKGLTGFGGVTDQTGALGTNSWGATISGSGAFVVEVVLTFLLVFVVLLVTNRPASAGFAGLAIGLSLAVIHLVAIPLDGTSVNPARSIGPALFTGGDALRQLWLFIVAPLIGGAIAAVVASFLAVTEVTEVQEPGWERTASLPRHADACLQVAAASGCTDLSQPFLGPSGDMNRSEGRQAISASGYASRTFWPS